jgi:hypothetical protein
MCVSTASHASAYDGDADAISHEGSAVSINAWITYY